MQGGSLGGVVYSVKKTKIISLADRAAGENLADQLSISEHDRPCCSCPGLLLRAMEFGFNRPKEIEPDTQGFSVDASMTVCLAHALLDLLVLF